MFFRLLNEEKKSSKYFYFIKTFLPLHQASPTQPAPVESSRTGT